MGLVNFFGLEQTHTAMGGYLRAKYFSNYIPLDQRRSSKEDNNSKNNTKRRQSPNIKKNKDVFKQRKSSNSSQNSQKTSKILQKYNKNFNMNETTK